MGPLRLRIPRTTFLTKTKNYQLTALRNNYHLKLAEEMTGRNFCVFVGEQATFERPSPESLQVSLTGALRTKVDGNGVNVMVALYESGLVIDCPSGENKGRVLSNDYVVRKLEKLCTVKDVSAKKTISGTITFPIWEGFNATKCGLVVFLQNSSHHIFGSQKFQLPDN